MPYMGGLPVANNLQVIYRMGKISLLPTQYLALEKKLFSQVQVQGFDQFIPFPWTSSWILSTFSALLCIPKASKTTQKSSFGDQKDPRVVCDFNVLSAGNHARNEEAAQ